jgi:predicted GNAT family acetyltransferase
MSDIQVTDNPELSRYEAHLDGQLAGFAQYELRPSSSVLFHTEVDPAFEGHGIGSTLIKQSLADVRAKAERNVIPTCPFYRGYLTKHPEYDDLIEPHYLKQLEADR